MGYQYPLDADWTMEEIIIVMDFYTAIEEAYESSIKKEKLIDLYKEFKKIVDTQSFEKKIDKDFYKVSGYSIFQVMKKTKDDSSIIKMQVE